MDQSEKLVLFASVAENTIEVFWNVFESAMVTFDFNQLKSPFRLYLLNRTDIKGLRAMSHAIATRQGLTMPSSSTLKNRLFRSHMNSLYDAPS